MSKLNPVGWLQRWMDSIPGQTFLNYAYSWGASVVILGALFKLTHLPGGNLMLFIGMGTEAFVFFLAAFDRPFDKNAAEKALAEELVIPEEDEDETKETAADDSENDLDEGRGDEYEDTETEDTETEAADDTMAEENEDSEEAHAAAAVVAGGVVAGGTVIAGGAPVVGGVPVIGGGVVGGVPVEGGAVAGGAPVEGGAVAGGAPVVGGTVAGGAPVVGGAVVAGGVVGGAPVVGGGVVAGGAPIIIGGGAAPAVGEAPVAAGETAKPVDPLKAAVDAIYNTPEGEATVEQEADKLATIIRLANDELLRRAQAVLSPDMEAATEEYIEKLKTLNETLAKVDEQSARLTRDSQEMENLNRTLIGINKVYDLHFASISRQVTTIEDINEQTRQLAAKIEEVNAIYSRMMQQLGIMVNPMGAAATGAAVTAAPAYGQPAYAQPAQPEQPA